MGFTFQNDKMGINSCKPQGNEEGDGACAVSESENDEMIWLPQYDYSAIGVNPRKPLDRPMSYDLYTTNQGAENVFVFKERDDVSLIGDTQTEVDAETASTGTAEKNFAGKSLFGTVEKSNVVVQEGDHMPRRAVQRCGDLGVGCRVQAFNNSELRKAGWLDRQSIPVGCTYGKSLSNQCVEGEVLVDRDPDRTLRDPTQSVVLMPSRPAGTGCQLNDLAVSQQLKDKVTVAEQERMDDFIVLSDTYCFGSDTEKLDVYDLEACKQRCRDRRYGAFVVREGTAYFREAVPNDCIANCTELTHSTVYIKVLWQIAI